MSRQRKKQRAKRRGQASRRYPLLSARLRAGLGLPEVFREDYDDLGRRGLLRRRTLDGESWTLAGFDDFNTWSKLYPQEAPDVLDDARELLERLNSSPDVRPAWRWLREEAGDGDVVARADGEERRFGADDYEDWINFCLAHPTYMESLAEGARQQREVARTEVEELEALQRRYATFEARMAKVPEVERMAFGALVEVVLAPWGVHSAEGFYEWLQREPEKVQDVADKMVEFAERDIRGAYGSWSFEIRGADSRLPQAVEQLHEQLREQRIEATLEETRVELRGPLVWALDWRVEARDDKEVTADDLVWLRDEARRFLVLLAAGNYVRISREGTRLYVDILDETLLSEAEEAAATAGSSVEDLVENSVVRYCRESGKRAESLITQDVFLALTSELRVIAEVKDPAPGATMAFDDPDAGKIELPLLGDSRAPLWLPTPTLRQFSALAREKGEQLALSAEDLATLRPDGRHLISGASVARNAEGHHYVRADMMLARLDGPQRWTVDLPLKQMGFLMEGLEAELAEETSALDALPRHELMGSVREPRWVGARSFPKLWTKCEKSARVALYFARYGAVEEEPLRSEMTEAVHHPVTLIHMDTLERLQRAQVLAVDVDVFEGAPEWASPREAWAFADDCKLPFDPLYLDLTAPGGLCPIIEAQTLASGLGEELRALGGYELRDTTTWICALHGALLWHGADGQLVVVPVGRLDHDEEGRPGTFRILGRVVFGGESPEDVPTYLRLRPSDSTLNLSTVVPALRPESILGEALPGRIEIPTTPPSDAEVADEGQVLGIAAQVAALGAGRALSVLSMLEAINVEIAQTTPDRDEKRMLKRAAKRDWPVRIADTVQVRPTKYDPTPKDREGEAQKREFSHAFWRRGNYAYFPLGTRLADKLAEEAPTKLVNHPQKGLCRKVYRGPVIVGKVGPDGREREAVVKTRVWRSEETKQAERDERAAVLSPA